ncbi:SPOR domain-containing protein [Pontibacter sp. JAM-7]|uniref:SPOR domain-containing protein n=1 Tax=Pontibacter sp. JAM-7 TaxID=3366581 RepID=UPI003AF90173
MAARKDYAKPRKQGAGASRPQRASAPKKPVKKPFPLGLLLITLILLGVLGTGLYFLMGVTPESVQAPTPAPVTETKPAAKPAPASKPAPAAETSNDQSRFKFYDMLRDNEVTPPADAYTSTPKDAKSDVSYMLQAGSFRAKSDAEKMRAQLILMGLPNVHTDASTSRDGSTWYRVRTGPYDNRSQMAKAWDKLVRQNIQPLQIRQ